MGEISVKTGNNARNGGKNSLNRLIRCVCGKKIGPDPRNFNQRVSLGRNDLLIRTFPNAAFLDGKSFEYKNGETNGETTKMTFFGPSGEVLKFLVNPVNNLYRMGLTSGATFEEINCTEI
ncbi:hypothetical protein AB6H35_27370 [Citrobacter freundii]|uniref:hypothetical protein n=2 Tax=Enterobacterales TaxID=91347 RepID=UPI0034DD15A6